MSAVTGVGRRGALFGGLAAGAIGSVAQSAAARAQAKVFLNYTQAELDRAYDQSAWAPNAAALQAAYAADSAAARKALPPRTFRYGPSLPEMLDVFGGDAGRAPIHVFVHGGAWRLLTKDDASAPAANFVDRGGVYVALNFAAAPGVRLPEMVEQCRRALLWVHANAASFGGNADRITLSGHSSGGHIAAALLTTDWVAEGGPPDLLKGGLLMSGIYELYPVMLSSRRDYLTLTGEDVVALSPLRHLDRLRCLLTIAWGDLESPEFKRQGATFADAVQGMGLLKSRHVLFDTNHFQMPMQLYRPDTPLGLAALTMMGLV